MRHQPPILTDVPAAAQTPRMTGASWAMLFALGAIWGGSFFFARIAVAEIAPLTLVLFRVSIAALALHLFLAARGASFRAALPFAGSLAVLALLNNLVPFSLIFAGQTELGAGLASVLNATTPFWTILIANRVTTDERLTVNKVAGILLGIAGAAIMIGPGVIAGLGGPVWAKLALVAASVSYALAAIYAKRFRGMAAPVVAAGQLTASTILMAPVVLVTEGASGLFEASAHVWMAVVALAVVSTAVAYILFFTLIASSGATNASLVTLIVPASAILLGAIFLGERLESFEIAGMAVIAAGLVTIDGRLFDRRRKR